MKHQYEDYIEWINYQKGENCLDSNNYPFPCNDCCNCASYNANRAVLERHKPEEVGGQVFCFACESDTEYDDNHLFPCPTLLDVTNQLDEVM